MRKTIGVLILIAFFATLFWAEILTHGVKYTVFSFLVAIAFTAIIVFAVWLIISGGE